MANLSSEEVLAQSRSALGQWEPRWKEWAARNAITYRRRATSHKELLCKGVGRRVVCVGMGPSLEEALPILKEYKDHIDIACVDKGFGVLLDAGIVPTWCFVADAGINYGRWLKPWVDRTDKTHLVSNICANPEFSENWKGPVSFFVNKDNLHTEVMFSEISGCFEAIPAASNVGNIVVVFLGQVLGYDRYLLTGYDFCWHPYGNYYAWNFCPDKRSYMHHVDLMNSNGEWVWTSSNLQFSARWLSGFVGTVARAGICVMDCSGGILETRKGKLGTECEFAKRVGTRRWTDREKKEYIDLHAQRLTLAVQDFDKIQGLLGDENMATLAVTLTGVPKAVAQYAAAK